MQPDFYPHKTKDIALIQTHISWLILAGDYAYKVKKPVNFGFLDFTDLEKRRYFCQQELQLNRRFSPELYLKVLPVRQENGSFQLGGQGNIVEYTLKLVRFPQENLLSRCLETDHIQPQWMDELAGTIAEFHTRTIKQEPGSIRKFGGVASIRARIESNLDVADRLLAERDNADVISGIRLFCNAMIDQFGAAIEQRRRDGFVRDCHGDMHLGNIVLVDGKPRLFDCIEFNDEFRVIDVMNDVAFLVMDCDAKRRPDLGFRFLSRYLELTADYPGLYLLPLYLTYRACVRGKVACLLADDPGLDSSEKATKRREAAASFSLARQYTEQSTPALFIIGGLSGSGKSHLALQALSHIPAIIIRSDATRKRLATLYPDEPLYGRNMDAHCYKEIYRAAEITLRAGFTVILDATFLRQSERDEVRMIAKRRESALHIYWLDMDAKLLRKRIRNRLQAGTDISDADLDVLQAQLDSYQRPREKDIEFITDSSIWPANS